MTATLATTNDSDPIELALINGDLSRLSGEQRLAFYKRTCESLDLNPLTQPFDYIMLNGKLKLYALKSCADQLRKRDKISLTVTDRQVVEGVYLVTVQAKTPDGRVDEDQGAAVIAGLKGDNLINAYLKAITKAKRRVTLSICGLGMLDETEVESIPNAFRDPAMSPDANTPTPEQRASTPQVEHKPPTIYCTGEQKAEVAQLCQSLGYGGKALNPLLLKHGAKRVGNLTTGQAADMIGELRLLLRQRKQETPLTLDQLRETIDQLITEGGFTSEQMILAETACGITDPIDMNETKGKVLVAYLKAQMADVAA